MKKTKLIILSILLFALTSVTLLTYDVKAYAKYDDLNPFFVESGTPNYNYIRGVLIPQVFNITPLEVWDLFLQEGVKIYVTQGTAKFDPITDSGKYSGRTYGVTVNYNTSTNKISKVTSPIEIYINANNSTADAFYHECGHAFDCMAGYITGYYKGSSPISDSSEWQNLYSKYSTSLASFDFCASINMGNTAEAFAESYRLYLLYPQQLQASCPEVYTFVANQIAKYTAYVPEVTYNTFDYESYAYEYPDLMQAFGLDKKALWNHYKTCGKAEGRKRFRFVYPKR